MKFWRIAAKNDEGYFKPIITYWLFNAERTVYKVRLRLYRGSEEDEKGVIVWVVLKERTIGYFFSLDTGSKAYVKGTVNYFE